MKARAADRWQTGTFSRGASLVLVVGVAGVLGYDSAVNQGNGLLDLILALSAASVGWWLLAVRPYVAIEGKTLVIQNPVRRRTVTLHEISGVQPGYAGLEIATTRGRTVSAWAVQRWNLSAMLGRSTSASEVADAILRAARRHRME